MNKKIIVTGSLAFDYIMNFPGSFAENIDPEKLHIMSISFLVETLKKEKGGTAGNIAYNLALLNSNPAILATCGDDFDNYAVFLKSSGVDIGHLKVIHEESTSLGMIMTDQKDNQITAFYPGAMNLADTLSLKDSPGDFCVIAPTKPEAMKKMVKESKELRVPYLYDPGMQLPRLSDEEILEGIEGAEVLIGNDYEMGIIKKRLNLTDEELIKKAKILIATLGEQGSEIKTQKETIKVKAAKPVEVKDPTGAGDAYRAGFLAGYLKDLDLKICAQMGGIASCYAVEKYGTTNHKFTIQEFCQRYQENFQEELNFK